MILFRCCLHDPYTLIFIFKIFTYHKWYAFFFVFFFAVAIAVVFEIRPFFCQNNFKITMSMMENSHRWLCVQWRSGLIQLSFVFV